MGACPTNMFMKRILHSLMVLLMYTGIAFGQANLSNTQPTTTINFSSTTQATVSHGAFNGGGFSPAVVTGRLNSNAWETLGWENGNQLFGEPASNPAHGRGAVSGGVVTEGIYAYTDSPHSTANPALLIQPGDDNFLPGSLTLRIKNTGSLAINQLSISYNVYVRNDQATSTSFNFSHSDDNVNFTEESSLDYISPDAADSFQWTLIEAAPARSITIPVNISPGEFYYIRWSAAAVSGIGPRDEFGLDDIVLTGLFGAPAPEINVTSANSSANILNNDLTPSTTDGTVFVDTFTGSSQTLVPFWIHNLGAANLNVSSIAVEGADPASFTVTTFTSGNIAPGSHREINVIFQPTSVGMKSAIITIYNNDSNENPYRFKIQGLGKPPQADAEVYAIPALSSAQIHSTSMIPSTANKTLFPDTIVGLESAAFQYRIKNTGGGTALVLTDPAPYIYFSGNNPEDFVLTEVITNPNINVGASRTFSIKFVPTQGGIRSAIVTIPNNDVVPDVNGNVEGPYTFLIQGKGVAPEIDLTGNSQLIVNGSTVPALSNHTFFDYVNIASGQVDRTFTIRNSGDHPLTVGAVTITGSSGFSLLSTPASSVPANGTTTFTIRFNPSVIGLNAAVVSVVNNDANENPYTFSISGYGIDYIPCATTPTETIAIQDFEITAATPTWNHAVLPSSLVLTTQLGYAQSGDGGGSQQFIGSRGLRVKNGSGIFNLASVNTSQYSEVELNFKLSSLSANVNEGADSNDHVSVYISVDGGATWSREIQVSGSTNAKWSFQSGTAIASGSYDGNNVPVQFAPSSTGFITSQGYGVVSLSNLPKVPNLMVRITMENNNVNEIWAIDNIALFGRRELSTTWNGSNWSAGAPTSSTKAIINGNYDTASLPNINACKCEIMTGRTVTVRQDDFLLIQSDFVNNGTIVIENGGSLVQKNDFAANAGNIVVKRHTTPVTRYDFTYWSSPVVGETLYDLSPNTLADKYFQFEPTTNIWQSIPSFTVMQPGKGYIVRAPQTFNVNTPTPYTGGQFTGLTNNGFIDTAVLVGASNWNLIGNPYPSAIDADLFLSNTANASVLGGTIYFWTHNTPMTNNVYTADDYALYNQAGGIGTAAANGGINNTIPTGTIASGQGFFVTATGNGNATFNNGMRITGNNMAFFRQGNVVATPAGTVDKNRVWINMTNSAGAFKQLLVGYFDQATNGIDRDFDGEILEGGNVISFYSTQDEQKLSIQGRAMPFSINDIVPLGYRTSIAGEFKIGIEKRDGLLASQNIYLEDKVLNIIHDLTAGSYTFVTETGTFDNRFQLRYASQSLNVDEIAVSASKVMVTSDNGRIAVKADQDIRDILIYDIVGRSVYSASAINNNYFEISSVVSQQQTLVVKITLVDGTIVNRKIVN